MAFLLNSQVQSVSDKMSNLPKHHGAGPPEARGPMQMHWLHRLKAGPAYIVGEIYTLQYLKMSDSLLRKDFFPSDSVITVY